MNALLAAPFVIGLVAAVVALVADGWSGPRPALRISAIGLGVAAIVAVAGTTGAGTVFGLLRSGDGYSIMQALCFALGAGALIAGTDDLAARPHGGQVAALVAFSAVGSAALVGVTELVGLLVVLESVALLGYALVASSRTHAADEAAMKYFVQGSVAAGLLVYGVGVLLARDAHLDALSGRASLAAVVLVACALAFKLGAFPFHSWVPDAYQAAPAPVAAFLATAPKVAAMVAVAGFFDARRLGAAYPQLATVFAALAVASIVFGNLAALRQTSFARLLGYSAVAGAGYALVAMVLPLPRVWVALFAGAYGLAAFGSFVAAHAIVELRPDWDGTVRGLAGLGRTSPVLAGSLATLMLSLTGIPLTAGFWGKVAVFLAAMQSDWSVSVLGLRIDGVGLAIVGVIGSAVSFGYYGAVLRSAFLEPSASGPEAGGRTGAATWMTVAIAVLVVVLGVLPFLCGLGPIARIVAMK